MFRVVLFVVSAFAAAAVCSAATLPDREGRIIGGSDASIYDFPHQVSLRHNGREHCGGSIYSQDIVLTAGLCAKYHAPSDLVVGGGSTFLYSPEFQITVKKFIVHPKFKTSNPIYDVAVLVLSEPLRFGLAVQPIALARERPPAGTIGTITGWGQLDYHGPNNNHLQKIEVNVLTKLECLKEYPLALTGKEICTYTEGKDACHSDRGGPMVVNNQLMGIVSWGGDCGRSVHPRVHASVPDLYTWIVQTVEENTSFPE